jgi:release factor glutamine methyltransferase
VSAINNELKAESDHQMPASIGTALTEAARTLQVNGVNEPRLDAGVLMNHVLGHDRAFLVAHPEALINEQQAHQFEQFVARRAQGEPLQYITGHQEFFNLDFEVTPDVLIPRPETELIVEAVLDLIHTGTQFTFADIGTGSGCLAISILNEFKKARGIAIDISAPALPVAGRNAERHCVADRLRLVQSDLFAAAGVNDMFDLIVSNPPYVSDDEINRLQREVRREPRSALAGGSDGLAIIRRLLLRASSHLKRGGYLLFEFGINQERAIRDLIDREGWKLIEIRNDLQQIPRIMILQRKEYRCT